MRSQRIVLSAEFCCCCFQICLVANQPELNKRCIASADVDSCGSI